VTASHKALRHVDAHFSQSDYPDLHVILQSNILPNYILRQVRWEKLKSTAEKYCYLTRDQKEISFSVPSMMR
jgi:hypothetical protein